MFEGDFSSFSIVARFLSIVASIVIGGFMALQTYNNAVKRRNALLVTVREGERFKSLRHILALFCNILFLWLLQVSVVVLCAAIVGYGARETLESSTFISISLCLGLPLVVQALRGRDTPFSLLSRIRL
ncbi:MAG: hypothetical protein K0U41_08815 [Gammaproteobacteria bacterium]|nr:hypothetical protein [Gammaproteobacteria bacterium]